MERIIIMMICAYVKFKSGTYDQSFKHWVNHGLTALCTTVENGKIVFSGSKGNIQNQDFLDTKQLSGLLSK